MKCHGRKHYHKKATELLQQSIVPHKVAQHCYSTGRWQNNMVQLQNNTEPPKRHRNVTVLTGGKTQWPNNAT